MTTYRDGDRVVEKPVDGAGTVLDVYLDTSGDERCVVAWDSGQTEDTFAEWLRPAPADGGT